MTDKPSGFDALKEQLGGIHQLAEAERKKPETFQEQIRRIENQRVNHIADLMIAANLVEVEAEEALEPLTKQARRSARVLGQSVPAAAAPPAQPAPVTATAVPVSQPIPPSAPKVVDWKLDDDGDDDVPPPPPVAPRPAKPTPVAVKSDVSKVAPALYTRDQLKEMSNDALAELARFWKIQVGNEGIRRTPLIELIIAAQLNWCAENGVDDPNATPSPKTQVIDRQPNGHQSVDPRKWDRRERLAGFLGGILGLFVAYVVAINMFDLNGSRIGDVLFILLWYSTMILLGAWLSSDLMYMRRPREDE